MQNYQRDVYEKLDKMGIDSKNIIIKPNWVSSIYGVYTEKEVLELIFQYFKEKTLYIVESYTAWRNEPYLNKEELLPKNCDILVGELYKDWLKEQDEWFFEYTGIKELIDNYNVQYINITEEYWNEDCVSSDKIIKILNKKDSKVKFQKSCNYFPSKLFEIRNNSTFISLGKIKSCRAPIGFSGAFKNLFGLIPDPARCDYHGEKDKIIKYVLEDIRKIYTSIFNKIIYINEGLYTNVFKYFTKDQSILKNNGYFIVGNDHEKVDLEAMRQVGVKKENVCYY